MSESASRFGHRRLHKPYVSQFAINRLMPTCNTLIAAVPAESPRSQRRARAAFHGGSLRYHFSPFFSLHHTFNSLHIKSIYVYTSRTQPSVTRNSRFCPFILLNENSTLNCIVSIQVISSYRFLRQKRVKVTRVDKKNEVQRRQLRTSAQGRLVPFLFPPRLRTSRWPAQCRVANRI